MKKMLKLAGVVAGLGLWACGGGGHGPVALADLEDEFIDANCDHLEACGRAADHADCVALFHQVFDVGQLVASVSAGRVTYDADAAGECLDYLSDTSCDQTSESVRADRTVCDEVFAGTVALGGDCITSQECASGSCQNADDTSCMPGQCVPGTPDAGVGDDCSDANCIDSICDGATHTCVALFAEGAACEDSSECDYGLSCFDGTCQSARQTGDSCSDDCALAGDDCAGPEGSQTCQHAGDVGDACGGNAPDCKIGVACGETSHVCEAGVDVGESCTANPCRPTSFCNATTAVCELKRDIGGACMSDGECLTGVCDQTGTCIGGTVCNL